MLPPLIFAAGPPRSGTTFLARLLHAHPSICAIVNNDVLEPDALFSYTTRQGLLGELQQRQLDSAQAEGYLFQRLVDEGAYGGPAVRDVADSPELASFAAQATGPPTRCVPIEHLRARGIRLCLKSPMASGFLARLADLFPSARFVVTFRSPIETAESMYHIAETKWPNAYHHFWEAKMRDDPDYRPPVRAELAPCWGPASGFQKCLIHTVSILRTLREQCAAVGAKRLFLYDHNELIRSPAVTAERLAARLGVEPAGFLPGLEGVRQRSREIPAALRNEYAALDATIGAGRAFDELAALARDQAT